MANDNTLSVVIIIFCMVMLILGLVIFFPAEDKKSLSISNTIQEEKTDLSNLPRQIIDTSICYEIMSCSNALEKEGTTLEDVKKMGLELNCEQIPCYIQGVNYHA